MLSPALGEVKGEPVNPTGKQGAATPGSAEQMKAPFERLDNKTVDFTPEWPYRRASRTFDGGLRPALLCS